MDEFVKNKLLEWQLSELEERFEANKVTEESLFFLTENDITELLPEVGLRARFRHRLEQFKNEQNKRQETPEFYAQVSLSGSSKGKRQSDLHGESSERQPPTKRQRDSVKETRILSEVKHIMKEVKDHINDKEQLGAFIKNKISDLETDKRELVGVFGRTGAGKSSLINAIINEMNLLPTGPTSACTTVMIKVEANTRSSKYEAEIEFIKKEEWDDELWSLKKLKEADDDYQSLDEKLSALYGEERKDKSPETLMEPKYFKNIPEFLKSKKKSLECDTAQELSQRLCIYTKPEDGKRAHQWFWPLVKCVTVRVPHNELLQHVTLMDLPGNGDCNKSRSEMWKQIVGDCSTVWIVAEIKRAASETDAWEILKSGLIGNGGQCQQIHFICSMSDPADDRVTKNKEAKEKVMNKFHTVNKTLSEQFSDKDFKVFTVSAQEVLKRKRVKDDDNEIPKLQDFLQNLNECHSETDIYVTGAYGILSLIEGARCRNEGVGKADGVCEALEKNMTEQLDQVKKAVEKAIKDFEQCLTEGVKNSQTSEEKLKTFLDSDGNTIVFKQLQAVVRKNGIHKPKNGEEINLNTMLASCLTDSIDKKFRKTFPNDVKSRYFNGVISRFSLDTKPLIQENLDVKLQLIFLQTEEERIKAKLNKIILKEKKVIYNSLTETIMESMQKGYDAAKKISGKDALENMRNTLETHVSSNRNMYENAKKTMLEKMDELKTTICKELKETMEHSIKLSFKADVCLLPDVSEHLKTVQPFYDEVKKREREMPAQ
ncbi:hypothetical protein ACER0C_003359 [Sarotherodon galilaeus]